MAASWEIIMKEATAKHNEEVPQGQVERPHNDLGRVISLEHSKWSQFRALREPKEMSNSTAGLGIAGRRSWKTSWWSWCSGRGSPAAATVSLIQTEKMLIKAQIRIFRSLMEQQIMNYLLKNYLFGWVGQSLANLSTSCLISDSAPLELEPSQII